MVGPGSMREQELLDALAEVCEGKAREEKVEVGAAILLTAHDELKEKYQLRKELEMARDEAQGMKPSVARKLNEKIRALEAELETLRTNKKVAELEKKVKFLEHELKQSYTTKNFTLKSGLLELEKQYRAHMNVDPAMAAFWADVTVLLDEKKDKESHLQFKGPPTLSVRTTPRVSSASQEGSATAAPQQTPPGSTSTSQGGTAVADAMPGADALAAAAVITQSETRTPLGVQMQVNAFNTIISEEAAGAASIPVSDSSSTPSGELVVRQAGSFRIVRSQQPQQQHAGGAAVGTPSAVDASSGPASSNVVEESLQPVRVLTDSYSNMTKDVTFKPLPASFNSQPAAAADSSSKQLVVVDARALDTCRDSICSSVADLQQLFNQLPPGSSTVGLQQQIQQVVSAAEQLTAADAAGQPQQQQPKLDAVLASVQQLRAALQERSSSDAAADAVLQQLTAVQQEAQRLQQLQQQAACQAEGQQVLVQVFGDFIQQLEQQGVINGSHKSVANGLQQQQQEQQHVLLELLQQFLQVNPQVPQLLASRLGPAAAPNSTAPAAAAAPSTALGTQQSPKLSHVSTQAAAEADTIHAETQSELLPSPTIHVSTQSEAVDSSNVHTQYDNSHMPALDVSTQASAEQMSAATQAEGVESSHAQTQSEPLPSPSTHASTQAAAEQATVSIQASPPGSPVHAQVQAELKPEVSEAGSQADLPPAAAPTAAAEAAAEPPSASSEQEQPHGSGNIYSASGSELSVEKAAIGQQLDVLHHLQRQRSNGAASVDAAEADSSGSNVSAVVEVKPEDLQDIAAVAKELSQLRADNMELAASLQVTKGLVDHLNSSMKAAIDKADDAEAEAAHARAQVTSANAALQQLQSEQAELTRLLIDAKVEIAEKKGELLKLVRNLRRAVEKPTSAAGMVKELQDILAVVPTSEGGFGELEGRSSAELQRPSAPGVSGGGFAGFAAGIGQALSGGSISRRSRAPSDGGSTTEGGGGSGGGRRVSEQ